MCHVYETGHFHLQRIGVLQSRVARRASIYTVLLIAKKDGRAPPTPFDASHVLAQLPLTTKSIYFRPRPPTSQGGPFDRFASIGFLSTLI